MIEDECAEGLFTKIWKELGVQKIETTPCKEDDEGCFSWNEFINDLGRGFRNG